MEDSEEKKGKTRKRKRRTNNQDRLTLVTCFATGINRQSVNYYTTTARNEFLDESPLRNRSKFNQNLPTGEKQEASRGLKKERKKYVDCVNYEEEWLMADVCLSNGLTEKLPLQALLP